MTSRHFAAAAVALLAVVQAVPASAQTGAPTAWELRIYAQGSSTALSAVRVTLLQVLCNQAPTPGTAPSVNPDLWEWPDVVATGRVCLFSDPARFQSLPDGAYEGTYTAINADGPAPEGPRIPFTRRRPNPPAVVTGGRVIRSATP